MHKRVIISILFLSYTTLFGQSRYGAALPDSLLIAVNTYSNALYVGIDNPILINQPYSDAFFIESTNGMVYQDSIYHVVMPSRAGLTRLILYEIKGVDTIRHGYKFFPVRNIPEPRLMLDNIVVNDLQDLSKKLLLNTNRLGIFVSEDIIGSENWFTVKKFSIGYIYGGMYVSYINESDIISEKTKREILRLSPGKQLIIKVTSEGEGALIKDLPIYNYIIY